jgi:hypothetical protein
MRRTVPVTVIELDAVGCGAAEVGRVQEIGSPGAAGHRDLAGGAHCGNYRLGLRCDRAGRARDHHADGVEQVPPCVVACLLGDGVE